MAHVIVHEQTAVHKYNVGSFSRSRLKHKANIRASQKYPVLKKPTASYMV